MILGATVFLGTKWKNMRFTYTEANLLPDHDTVNIQYNKFLDIFGEEGNLIVLAVKDSALFTPENFNNWNTLNRRLQALPETTLVMSTENLQTIKKNVQEQRFDLEPLTKGKIKNQQQLDSITDKLFNNLPFYDKLLFNKEDRTLRSVVYMDKEIVNTSVRKDFIFNDFIPLIEDFENQTGLDVKTSGMPYIRTLNSQNIIDEISMFILAALGVTSLIFFFFFRSFRATFISMIVVIFGVMWAFGILGLLNYEITVLTAIIPPLIIVIGIPNCIFLINKYQQEYQKHSNQAKALQRVISKVGNATLMTNATTAAGFATFIITESKLLKEFGIVASINILVIFMLSLTIIPIIYSFMATPKTKHLKHLNRRWVEGFVNYLEHLVKYRKISVYIASIVLLVASIIGIYKIRVSGSIIEDMPKSAQFFKDIKFFEEEFDGIMPLEIMIDTKRKNGVMKLPTLRRMEELQQLIEETPHLSHPLSVVNLAKYIKQAYYNGNPKYYELPTSQENTFILSYLKNGGVQGNVLNNFVGNEGQVARITTFMKDIGTDEMEKIEEDLKTKIEKLFPTDRYTVTVTGKAYMFTKGTNYLINNLVVSLALAIFLISLLMAYMFRSFKMIVVSLIPNILPLLITGGMMGYLGIPLKPSTILVFSIAFGISVDDTIHFLAKYRQELKLNNWKIKKSVFAALRESGVSMFYTSIVLFFGFSVFMISSFGGTKALGGLVSFTLLFAMLSNLVLLPTLLLSLERSVANKEEFIEPNIDILTHDDEEEELEASEDETDEKK
ncbi:transporter [Neptunitalea sp. Y10]|uniref:Transporter n=2 Tax=Neptunitalea lumnitzerae TaxID=2965509 RepID=A0ABQ5MMT1_9FLAO|nr:transporter [Neptunitalea sp. Y10]